MTSFPSWYHGDWKIDFWISKTNNRIKVPLSASRLLNNWTDTQMAKTLGSISIRESLISGYNLLKRGQTWYCSLHLKHIQLANFSRFLCFTTIKIVNRCHNANYWLKKLERLWISPLVHSLPISPGTWGRFNLMMLSYEYRETHYIDTTDSWLF